MKLYFKQQVLDNLQFGGIMIEWKPKLATTKIYDTVL